MSRQQCHTCGKWFEDEELDAHLQDHLDQQTWVDDSHKEPPRHVSKAPIILILLAIGTFLAIIQASIRLIVVVFFLILIVLILTKQPPVSRKTLSVIAIE